MWGGWRSARDEIFASAPVWGACSKTMRPPGSRLLGWRTGLRPPLPLQSNLSRRMWQMVHGQGAVLVGSDSDAVRYSVGGGRCGGEGYGRRLGFRGKSCPAVAGLYYAAEGAKEQSES